MRAIKLICLFVYIIVVQAHGQKGQQVYLMTKYHFSNTEQEALIDNYLKEAYLPAVHNTGINNIGVFKTIEGRNGDQKMVLVLVPFKSLKEFDKTRSNIKTDELTHNSAVLFNEANHDQPPFDRIENVLMTAFSSTPVIKIPEFDTPKKDRVYELRSYESSTPHLHKQKVKMFNTGESELFINLGFQPVFFASVFVGANMPNLVYLTCHADEEAQQKNWQKFRESEEWTNMKAIEEFKNTVSKSTKWYLYPAEYSDY